MIIKGVVFLLLILAVLAMFGRLSLRGRKSAGKCSRCGRPKIGKGPCPCQTSDR